MAELSPIEHAVLLMGAYELKNKIEIPYRVVINEAVELTKSFGGIDGHKYVNGVLDKLAAKLRPDDLPPERPKTAQFAERIRPAQPRSARSAEPAPAPMPLLPPPQAAPQPQAITQAAPPDPFALPVKPEDDLKQRALKSAFNVDKQLRKEAWTQRDRAVVNDTTPLAAAIGSAYVGGGSGAIGEMVMADGSRVTKWRMPGGGTACIYKEPNTFSGGRDPFRDTGRTSVRSCLGTFLPPQPASGGGTRPAPCRAVARRRFEGGGADVGLQAAFHGTGAGHVILQDLGADTDVGDRIQRSLQAAHFLELVAGGPSTSPASGPARPSGFPRTDSGPIRSPSRPGSAAGRA
jgi:hypothetical protein